LLFGASSRRSRWESAPLRIANISAWYKAVQGFIATRPSTRRRLLPRRPHPDIEFLFARYGRSRLDTGKAEDGTRAVDHQDLDYSWNREVKGVR